MRRAQNALIGLPLAVAVLWAGASVCPALLSQARSALAGDPAAAALPAARDLLLLALLGRAVLAFLPGGRPGGHGLGALPATWAASHLLASALLSPLPGPVPGWTLPAAGLLAAARFLTLPAPLLPGAPDPVEPTGPLTRAAGGAAVLVAVLLLCAGAGSAAELRAAADGVALAALGAHALCRLGRAAGPRRGVALLLLLTFPLVPRAAGPAGAELALLAGGALAGLVVRLGTADRRAAWLSIAGALGALSGPCFALLRGSPLSPRAVLVALLPGALLSLGLWAVPAGRAAASRLR